jgi:hypothetical protein
MAAADFDLGKLLAPVRAEGFLRDTWEKQPLVLRRADPAYYTSLFSLADVDPVIAFTRPMFTESGVFPGGPPAGKSYVQGWLSDRPGTPTGVAPGIAEVRHVFAQGRTVIIRAMQHRWPAVATLCRNLEAVFHCPVHTNLYLTPASAQGFDPHIDTHEVFALQIDGVKHWRLYGRFAELPLVDDKVSVPRALLGPPQEVRLEPGDLLYIPRGHAHEAFTTDSASLHLTVGVNIYRWADLLQQALANVARQDARFRESVPPGVVLGELPADVVRRFGELLQALADGTRAEDAARRLGDQFFEGLGLLPDSSFIPRDASGIDLDTVLEKAPAVVCRVLREGETVAIEFPGNRVSGPARIGPALEFAARSSSFPVRELPGDFGDESKLVLARRLVREGLLRVARPEGGGEGNGRAGHSLPSAAAGG